MDQIEQVDFEAAAYALWRSEGTGPSMSSAWEEAFTRHRTAPTAALTAERDALVAIVEKYARHDGLCGIIGGYGYCTCGLDAARKALRDPT